MTDDATPPVPDEGKLDFDALSHELRNSVGPFQLLANLVSDGIEMESFGNSRAGKYLLGMATRKAGAAIEIILKPSVSGDDLVNAVLELRVQHRVMQAFADALRMGRDAAHQLISNPATGAGDDDEPYHDQEE